MTIYDENSNQHSNDYNEALLYVSIEAKKAAKKATDHIRDSVEYKKMTPYLATAIAEGFCEGEDASEDEQIAAWQYLHDTRQAYSLQGWFGRTATSLIEQGIISA